MRAVRIYHRQRGAGGGSASAVPPSDFDDLAATNAAGVVRVVAELAEKAGDS